VDEGGDGGVECRELEPEGELGPYLGRRVAHPGEVAEQLE
jgi:hypothetical protein